MGMLDAAFKQVTGLLRVHVHASGLDTEAVIACELKTLGFRLVDGSWQTEARSALGSRKGLHTPGALTTSSFCPW